MSPLPAIDSESRGLDSYEAIEHELRTPLTSLRSIAEILRDYPDLSDDQRQRFLDSMIAENERLSRTVDRLLSWLDERAMRLS
jgi:signal transduction histidine kinase